MSELARDRCIAAISVAVALLILALIVVTSLQQRAASFEPAPCAGVQTHFAAFQVSACPAFRGRRGRCELTVGEPFSIKIDFKTPKAFTEAITYTKVNKLVDVFFLGAAGGHCPAAAGDRQRLSWNVVLPASAASSELTELMVGVRLAAKDEFLLCYTLPARILPAPASQEAASNAHNSAPLAWRGNQ